MSSYDDRIMPQIALDELIKKYETRLSGLKKYEPKDTGDYELLKQLEFIYNDLFIVKIKLDLYIKDLKKDLKRS